MTAFDFDLPESRIALRPISPQDAARLLVVHGDGRLEDAHIRDLPRYLSPGDHLVFNDTKVIPAALHGVRPARNQYGRNVDLDINLVGRLSADTWRVLARPAKRLKPEDRIEFADGLTATVLSKGKNGQVDLKFSEGGEGLDQRVDRIGKMPLPPYIARRRAADAQDRSDYQTSFAEGEAKSVAAPTAGLHFTPRLLGEIDAAGLVRETVRLHVGLGTFAPLTARDILNKRLHEEWREVSPDTAAKLNAARLEGQRCIAVGTTALRTLESAADIGHVIHPVVGPTDIFLQPGYEFRAADGLVTNFHLPASSLFMLVCALMGTDIMQAAYAHAIRSEYRFYSYGDACLLLPD